MQLPTVRVSWHPTPIPITTRRGRRYSPAMADAMDEWERRCKAEGIPFRETQGGFNYSVAASAGTHDGDAVDLSVWDLTREQVTRMIEIGRELGFAASFRTTKVAKWGTRAHGFTSYHVHAIPNLWGFPSPSAKDQARAYRNGRDGLASNGVDAGPGHTSAYRTRTWTQYIHTRPATPARPPIQEDIMNPAQEAKLDLVVKAVAERAGIERQGESAARQTVNFPIHRGGKPIPMIQETAYIRTDTIALRGELAALTKAVSQLAAGKVDMTAVKRAAEDGSAAALRTHEAKMAELLEGLEMSLRMAVVESLGDIDREYADAQADAVWQRLGELIKAGAKA